MPRLRERPKQRIPEGSQLETRPKTPHGFQRGRSKTGGRVRGQQNVVTRTIREGIIDGLNAAGGAGGVADYVTRIALEDPKLAVQMMALVVPRQAHVEVTRNEQVLLTIDQLDESLRRAGLPVSNQIFALDFKGSDPEDVAEAEVVAEEDTAKK